MGVIGRPGDRHDHVARRIEFGIHGLIDAAQHGDWRGHVDEIRRRVRDHVETDREQSRVGTIRIGHDRDPRDGWVQGDVSGRDGRATVGAIGHESMDCSGRGPRCAVIPRTSENGQSRKQHAEQERKTVGLRCIAAHRFLLSSGREVGFGWFGSLVLQGGWIVAGATALGVRDRHRARG